MRNACFDYGPRERPARNLRRRLALLALVGYDWFYISPRLDALQSKVRFTVSAQVRGNPGEKLDVPADAE